MEEILDDIATTMSVLDKPRLEVLVRKALEEGIDAAKVLQALNRGMELVGKKYDSSEFFLSEIVLAGSIVVDLAKIELRFHRRDSCRR